MDPYAARLMTGNRMMTANRPASSLMRIPTADGKRGPITGPIGLSSNVSIQHRPVTKQGISGMKNQSMGPARQIAGQSWYTVEVNRKSNELIQQIDILTAECDKIKQNNEKYVEYEKYYETLFAEVREKEGELADFNLALDKVRTNTNINDIKDAVYQLKRRNDVDHQNQDEIFAKCKKSENDAKEIEGDLEEIKNRIAERIREELGADVYNEYIEMQDESNHLQGNIAKKEEEIENIDSKIEELNMRFKSPEYQASKQAFELRKKQAHLRQQLQDLQEETSSNLSPGELRDLYATKIKESKKQVNEAQRRTRELEQATERYQDEIEQKETELKEAKRLAIQERKLEAVYEKANKINEFLDNFPTLRKEQLTQCQQLKNTIVALLKHIAEEMGQDSMEKENFHKIKDDFSFKEQKTKNSEETLRKVRQELENKRKELEKINNLDAKIGKEMESLSAEKENMEQKLGKFPTSEELQIHHQQEKKRLLFAKGVARKKREALKQQVHNLSREYEESKKRLASNDVNKRLEALEYKLRTRSQLVAELESTITQRRRETDYEDMKNVILATVKEINTLTVQSMK